MLLAWSALASAARASLAGFGEADDDDDDRDDAGHQTADATGRAAGASTLPAAMVHVDQRGGYSRDTKICIPITPDGQVDPRWGRAQRVAIATVNAGRVDGWEELDVGWGTLHDQGTEGTHHGRVARFLHEHAVELVVADHMGPGMTQMLAKMGIAVRLGASGSARDAVLAPTTLH